jgi:hypothetical protein
MCGVTPNQKMIQSTLEILECYPNSTFPEPESIFLVSACFILSRHAPSLCCAFFPSMPWPCTVTVRVMLDAGSLTTDSYMQEFCENVVEHLYAKLFE